MQVTYISRFESSLPVIHLCLFLSVLNPFTGLLVFTLFSKAFVLNMTTLKTYYDNGHSSTEILWMYRPQVRFEPITCRNRIPMLCHLSCHLLLQTSRMGRNLMVVRAHIGKAKLVLMNTHLESTAVSEAYSHFNRLCPSLAPLP